MGHRGGDLERKQSFTGQELSTPEHKESSSKGFLGKVGMHSKLLLEGTILASV